MKVDLKPQESLYADVNRCRASGTTGSPVAGRGSSVRHELIHRNWFEVRDKLLARFPILNHSDVEFEPGHQSDMMRAIEKKLNMSPCDLQRIIAYL